MRLLLLIPLALIIAACGGAKAATPGPATGVVKIKPVVDTTGGIFIEGFVWFINADQVNGDGEIVEVKINVVTEIATLPAGKYTLDSSVGACGGPGCANGGYSPPQDDCSGTFEVKAGETTEVVVTMSAGKPCQITT